jgi:hypothetical protein
MRPLTAAVCLFVVSIAGCVSTKIASTGGKSPATQIGPDRNDTSRSQPAAPPPEPVASNAPSRVSDTGPARSKPNTPSRPTKQPVPALPLVPTTPAVKARNSPAAATLDLGELESRLRDTHAIGVFTKLSLKNQVDDLLDEFRLFYRESNKSPSAELRRHYDSLLLKVLSLLKDGDPALAAAVSSSREAIWGILADPDKFAKL